MELQHFTLDQLKPAKINVRKTGGKEYADLVPSIRSLGLIQPLLVRPNCEGFEVVAGQRRYQALCELAGEGVSDPVPCVIMKDGDDAKAIEASLAENIARLPMDEIDQYKAFAALVKAGDSVADIASKFGVSERLVNQRMAIANLINPKGRAERSRTRTVESAAIRVEAHRDDPEKLGLVLLGADEPIAPTHWSFGQLSSLVGAPAAYLRQLGQCADRRKNGALRNFGREKERLELQDFRSPFLIFGKSPQMCRVEIE